MKTLSIKTGLWSVWTMLIMFIIWIICFTGIAIGSPLFTWNNMEGYLEYYQQNNQFFQNIAKSAMLFFGPVYVIFLNSLHDQVSSERKSLSRLGLIFGSLFAACSSVHYFVQLSTVRFNLNDGITAGIENIIQANPLSVMTAIDMLGWTLFLGLSSFFTFQALKGRERSLRAGFLINSISALIALIGYLFRMDVVTFFGVNLGIGGAIILISIGSIRLFQMALHNLNS